MNIETRLRIYSVVRQSILRIHMNVGNVLGTRIQDVMVRMVSEEEDRVFNDIGGSSEILKGVNIVKDIYGLMVVVMAVGRIDTHYVCQEKKGVTICCQKRITVTVIQVL